MKSIGISVLVLSIIPLIILTILLLNYMVSKNRLYNQTLTKNSQESVLTSLSSSISGIRNHTDEVIRSSAFLYYTNSSGEARSVSYAGELIESVQDRLSYYHEFAGVILYHKKTGRFLKHFSKLKYTGCEEYVSCFLKDFGSSRTATQETVLVSGEPMLLYRVSQRYGSIGILIDPSANPGFCSLRSAVEKKTVCEFSPVQSAEETFGKVLSTQLEGWPLFFNISLPSGGMLQSFDTLQSGILILLALIVVIAVFIFLFIRFQLLHPMESLSSAFGQIGDGDLDYRLKTVSRISEINEIYDNFNQMLDSIHDAEEESQSQRMDAMQAKLQYLQLQIRPHFYLNCLKNINALAEVHQDDKIQELVIYMSDYFRYSFQDVRNFVTIREELEAVQSYVNLCCCLYSTLSLQLNIESAVLQVQCLPMTILTFVENCIKHGGDIRKLEIRLSAFLQINDEEEPEAVIEIRNNGSFSEETLQDLNSSPVHTVSYGREHVGIKNVRYRLFLIYKERASVSFLNEPGFAVVRTVFPVENDWSSGELQ